MGAAVQLSKQLNPNPFCLGGQKTHLDCGPQGLTFTTPKLFAHTERLAHTFPLPMPRYNPKTINNRQCSADWHKHRYIATLLSVNIGLRCPHIGGAIKNPTLTWIYLFPLGGIVLLGGTNISLLGSPDSPDVFFCVSPRYGCKQRDWYVLSYSLDCRENCAVSDISQKFHFNLLSPQLANGIMCLPIVLGKRGGGGKEGERERKSLPTQTSHEPPACQKNEACCWVQFSICMSGYCWKW